MGANSPTTPVVIQIMSGPESGRSFQLTKAVITIGRDPNNDIAINDPTMSRQHARIQRDYQGLWSIEKLAATNTLLINQVEVQRSPLQDRDVISTGPNTALMLLLPQEDRVLAQQQETARPSRVLEPSSPAPRPPQGLSLRGEEAAAAQPMQSPQSPPFTP